MTGLSMLLSAMGVKIDPDEIMAEYERLKVMIPETAVKLVQTVESIDRRLEALEMRIAAIDRKQELLINGNRNSPSEPGAGTVN